MRQEHVDVEAVRALAGEAIQLVLPMFCDRLNNYLASALVYLGASKSHDDLNPEEHRAIREQMLDQGARLLTLTRKIWEFSEGREPVAEQPEPAFQALARLQALATELWGEEALIVRSACMSPGSSIPFPSQFMMLALIFLAGSFELAKASARTRIVAEFDLSGGNHSEPLGCLRMTATNSSRHAGESRTGSLVDSKRQQSAAGLLRRVGLQAEAIGWKTGLRDDGRQLRTETTFPLASEPAASGIGSRKGG